MSVTNLAKRRGEILDEIMTHHRERLPRLMTEVPLPGLLHRPPRAFADYAAHLAPATRVCLLEPGEALDIEAALP